MVLYTSIVQSINPSLAAKTKILIQDISSEDLAHRRRRCSDDLVDDDLRGVEAETGLGAGAEPR
jgi:hypothetical protein